MEIDSIKRQALTFALKLNSAADVRQLINDATKIEAYLQGVRVREPPEVYEDLRQTIENLNA